MKATSSVSELQMRCRRPPAKFHGSNTILISFVFKGRVDLYASQVPAVGSALRLLHLAGPGNAPIGALAGGTVTPYRATLASPQARSARAPILGMFNSSRTPHPER